MKNFFILLLIAVAFLFIELYPMYIAQDLGKKEQSQIQFPLQVLQESFDGQVYRYEVLDKNSKSYTITSKVDNHNVGDMIESL